MCDVYASRPSSGLFEMTNHMKARHGSCGGSVLIRFATGRSSSGPVSFFSRFRFVPAGAAAAGAAASSESVRLLSRACHDGMCE